MKRYLALAICIFAITASSGCLTLNWAHNRRHVKKFFDDLTQLHADIDRVIFGLERNPAE